MKNYIYLLFVLMLLACSSKPKGAAQADSTSYTNNISHNSLPFDLAKLTFNENLSKLMVNLSLKPEANDSLNITIAGYEVFKSSNPKVLHFENKEFLGSKNHVLFHYQKEHGTLVCYELILYSQGQTDALITLLEKSATLIFKQTKPTKGSIELDENGNEVSQQNSERKTFRVWENKHNGLSYFLSETGTEEKLITKLIVLKKSTSFGRDWISTLSLDWYKNAKSEAL